MPDAPNTANAPHDLGSDGDDVADAMAAAKADAAARGGAEPKSIDEVLKTLPEVRYGAPTHEAVWQMTQGFLVPLPLGRFGTNL